MTTAIKLAGWEDLSTEVQGTFGELGEAIVEKPFAIRPVAKRILKWSPRPLKDAILSMANSLVEHGFV